MSASPVSTRPYALTVENGTLNYSTQSAPDADATVTLTKATLDSVQLGQVSLAGC
jgi:linear primary-alkylsulfatase